MTTDMATRTQEILSTTERDGQREHRIRWTFEGGRDVNGDPMAPSSGEMSASEPIEPVSRAVLLDRYVGLTCPGGNNTDLGDRLDTLLTELAEGVSRRELQDKAVIGGEVIGLDFVFDIDDLEKVIRDWIIERAAAVAE